MSDVKVFPRDVAGQDVERLIEGRADVAASERLIELLDVKEPLQRVYAEALGLTGQRLNEHRGLLREAVVKNSVELTETGDAGVALDAALRGVASRYKHLRGVVESSYLNPDPDLNVLAAELEQRRKVFARAFAIAPATFERMSNADILERSGFVIDLLDKQPQLVAPDSAARYKAAHEAAALALKDWSRERKEDLEATVALNEARASFDSQATGHRLTVEAALWQLGRSADIGQFIKAREPGYASRREAGLPIVEEPDAEDGLAQ
jgi:hypothetical protein